MFSWRVTKYNPKKRDENGYYLFDDWTCYSQINTIADGKLLTYAEYLTTEDAYIDAIELFMTCNNLTELSVSYLEKYWELDHDPNLTPEMIALFARMKKGLKLNKDEVKTAARLILRGDLWCKLETEKMFVHFGYDYYMYIGSANLCAEAIHKIEQNGLFVENFV
jgi:hypothetical protein